MGVAQNNLEMALLLKMFKFFILLLSTFTLVVTADDDEIVKSYGKHRFLKVIEGKNYLKMDNGPKFSTYLADVLTKPELFEDYLKNTLMKKIRRVLRINGMWMKKRQFLRGEMKPNAIISNINKTF